MSDVRRCRRCKRKRLDDEPPEVRQYKTCAKCRIIERQKKKLRKPLAEETMIYGMKQFQQQNQNANFIHDDIFMDDDVFSGGVRNSARRYEGDGVVNPLQQQLQHQQQFYQFQPQQTSHVAMPTVSQVPVAPLHQVQHQVQQQQVQQQHQVQQQQAHRAHQQHMRNMPVQVSMPETVSQQPINCEICSTKLDHNDELNMNYRLCLECYSNPFRQDNVYGNYNEFLMAITTHKYKDIKNYIYIKETDKTFSDHLVYQNRPINSERLYREFILENIQIIYLDPIIASLGCKFNRVSSNVSETNSLPPVFNPVINQYQYKNTKPIRSYHKYYKESACDANIYMTFDFSTNILTIKLNQKVFNNSSNYPSKFIDLVHSILKSLAAQDSKSNVGYNYHTALIIFDELIKNKYSYPPDIQQFLSTCNSSDFARDFINFEETTEVDATKKKDPLPTKEDEADQPVPDQVHGDARQVSHVTHVDEEEEDEDEEDDEEEDEEDEDEEDDRMSQSTSNVLPKDQSRDHTDTPSETPIVPSEPQPQINPTVNSDSAQNGLYPKPTGENLDPAFGQ